MKKRLLIFIGLMCTLFLYSSVHAESKEITCTQTFNNGTVHIQGQISDVVSSHHVTLLVSEDIDNVTDENIAYIDQTTSETDGTFEFSFTLSDVKSGTIYEYKIGSDADTAVYTGVLNFGESNEELPSIKTIICTEESNENEIVIRGQISNATTTNHVTLIVSEDINNITDENIVYIDQTTSTTDGTFEFSFTLSNVKSGTIYEYKIGSDANTVVYTGVLNLGEGDEELPSNKTIICTEETNGNEIVIRGQISNATTTNHVTLIVSEDINNITDENIVYIDQTTSTTDGTFEFSFTINGAIDGESYGYKVGSDSGADVYTGIITIVSQTEMVRREFIDANVNVNIVNYVPSISGTITCVEGKTATINIVNTTDNQVIANDVLTEGVHNISYRLPSLISAKKYTLIVTGCNGTQDLGLLSVTIDSSVLLVTISGSVDIADGVIMDVSVQSNNTGLIDKSATITKDRTLSVTLPNIVANTSYHLTATGYELVPVVFPEDKVLREEYVVSGKAGDSFKITVTGTYLSPFDEVFNLEYDSAQIKPTNLFGAYYEDSLQPGIKGDVEIISYEPGLIQFRKVNRGIPNGKLWSGVLNIFEFEFNHNYSGNTTVCLCN